MQKNTFLDSRDSSRVTLCDALEGVGDVVMLVPSIPWFSVSTFSTLARQKRTTTLGTSETRKMVFFRLDDVTHWFFLLV
jgi:hypothetical protein